MRMEAGLTQPQLARLLGVSQPTVVNYEYGRSFPRDAVVQRRLKKLFGVSVPEMFSPENEKDPAGAGS